jgi:hypothetical protein
MTSEERVEQTTPERELVERVALACGEVIAAELGECGGWLATVVARAAIEATGIQSLLALREGVAEAMLEPLGYVGTTLEQAEHVWVGNNVDDVETGSLAHLCRALASVALAKVEAQGEQQ